MNDLRQITAVVKPGIGKLSLSQGTGRLRRALLFCAAALALFFAASRADAQDHYLWQDLAGRGNCTGDADGTGRGARFNCPDGIVVDSNNIVYVADFDNCTIRKITPQGVTTTLAGCPGSWGSSDGTGRNAGFRGPGAIAIDGSNNLYVADSWNYTIREVTPDGVVTTLAGTPGIAGSADGTGTNAQFYAPYGLAVDGSNNLYVADSYNSTVRKITPAGVVTTLAGIAGVSGTADGTGTNAQFNVPTGLALDAANNLYIADQWNNTIRKMTPDGTVTTLAGWPCSTGTADGKGTAARFNCPSGLTMGSDGNLYVADYANDTIRRVTLDGEVTTLAGKPGITVTRNLYKIRLDLPSALTRSTDGTFYIADTGHQRVLIGQYAPTKPQVTTGSAAATSFGCAALNGTVDPEGLQADAYFEYGATRAYGSTSPVMHEGDGIAALSCSASITVPDSGTVYHYRLVAHNSKGTACGNDATFTSIPSSNAGISALELSAGSLTPSFVEDGTAYATTVANCVNSTTVTAKLADQTATAQVRINGGDYKKLWQNKQSSPLTLTDTGNTPNLIEIHVLAQDGTTSQTYAVTVDRAIAAVTGNATDIGADTATLNASVAGYQDSVYFEYGLTDNYGATTTPQAFTSSSSNQPTNAACTLTGLAPATLYHYHVVQITGSQEDDGDDATFVTSSIFPASLIAARSGIAPGFQNAQFASFGNPAISGSADTAFLAVVSGSGITNNGNRGIWLQSGSTTTLVVRTGSPVSYSAGSLVQSGTFLSLNSDPVFNDYDQIAFLGTVKTGTAGNPSTYDGIWMTGTAGDLIQVARAEGNQPTAATGTSIASFAQFVLTDQGSVAFLANLAHCSQETSPSVWVVDTAGQSHLVARKGCPIVTTTGTQPAPTALSIFTPPSGVCGQTRSFNADGGLLFVAAFAGGGQGVFCINPDATVTLARATSDSAPLSSGSASFSKFDSPILNDAGYSAFKAVITGSGVNAATQTGIWAQSGTDGALWPVARQGIAASYMPDAAATGTAAVTGTFTALGDPVFNANNQVAFIGTVKTGTHVAASYQGIWATGTANDLWQIAQAKSLAPICTNSSNQPTSEGAVFSTFDQVVLPDAGGVVFVASLEKGKGGVSDWNNQGIWAVDTAGNLNLVARKGDVLVDAAGNPKTVSTLSIFNASAAVAGQTRSFNSSGDLVYKVTFTDKSEGIYKVVFP